MFNLFKKTIRVTFINETNGENIGVTYLKPDQLPYAFDKPTTMQLSGKDWQVIKADPVHSNEFTFTKKLTLYLRAVEQIDVNNILFSIPTIANELPGTVAEKIFHDFILELHEDDWRQTEFLPVSLLPVIQEEMAEVEKILFSENESGNLAGYKNIHVRKKPGRKNLSISFDEFYELVGIKQKGAVQFLGYTGFVQDGFALQSANYTYYGTIENGIIKELCLQRFNHADDEFYTVAGKYNLVMVDWCSGQITTV